MACMILRIPTVVKSFLLAFLVAAVIETLLAIVYPLSSSVVDISVFLLFLIGGTYLLYTRWGSIWYAAGRRIGDLSS